MRKLLALLFFIFALRPFLALSEDANLPEPIQEGTQCFDDNAEFISTESTRTPWTVSEIVAVPVGTTPDQWEEYGVIKERIAEHLPTSPDSAAYAQAMVAVWKDFFADQADVLANLGRTIDKTDTKLQCISGSWVYVSTAESTVNDTSDWLSVGSDSFDVNNAESQSALIAGLTNLLNTLNSQPGAQNQQGSGQ